jgi:hypothetical protein
MASAATPACDDHISPGSLYPARFRKYLFKWLLGHGNYLAFMIEDDGPGTGCPLIQSQDILIVHN